MKNNLLNFDARDTGYVLDDKNMIISDYFSKKTNFTDILTDDVVKTYLEKFKLSDDDNLERISFNLYGTPDYWDLLILINSKDPLFEMVFNYDIITDANDTHWSKYLEYSNVVLTDVTLADEMKEQYLQEHLDENESNRYIYVVKQSKLNIFLKLLKENGYL